MFHRFLVHSSVGILASHLGYKSILPHDALNFLVIHVRKSHFDCSPAKLPFALVKNLLDSQEVGIVPVSFICLQKPFVISAS